MQTVYSAVTYMSILYILLRPLDRDGERQKTGLPLSRCPWAVLDRIAEHGRAVL